MPTALHNSLYYANIIRSVFFTLEIAAFKDHPERNLTLDLAQATVGHALEAIERQDHRYTYEVIDSHLIHVFPRGAKQDPYDLLNVAVANLKIPETPYDNLLQYPRYFIPQLEAVIERREGTAGYAASMLGSADAPKVSITLEAGTVRDVLNAVSEKMEAFRGDEPIGWIYTFHIEKNDPLGGQPKWQVF